MQTIAIQQAEGHLAEIIDKLSPGEEIVVTRDDQPVATIKAAAQTPRQAPRFGTLRGTILYQSAGDDGLTSSCK